MGVDGSHGTSPCRIGKQSVSHEKKRKLVGVGNNRGEVERMADLVANLEFSRRDRAQISTFDVCAETAAALELIESHLRNRNIVTNFHSLGSGSTRMTCSQSFSPQTLT